MTYKILNTFLGLLITTSLSVAQSSWKFVEETYIKGSISGTITKSYIFKTSSNNFYVVNESTRQRVRARNPEVTILGNDSDYKLIIEDFEEPVICRKLKNVIETEIDGDFEGWEGETIFKMMNGHIWKQSSYAYFYHYSYSPKVSIYEFDGSYVMRVENDKAIEVIQLK